MLQTINWFVESRNNQVALYNYISKYQSKTNEPFSIPPDFQLAFDEEHGIFCFSFSEFEGREWLEICCACVDSWKWLHDSVKDAVIQTISKGGQYDKLQLRPLYPLRHGVLLVFWDRCRELQTQIQQLRM